MGQRPAGPHHDRRRWRYTWRLTGRDRLYRLYLDLLLPIDHCAFTAATTRNERWEIMSILSRARWSRREVLKQSGILSAGAAMAPLSASASSMIDNPTNKNHLVESGTK